jgi:hypothetical protein
LLNHNFNNLISENSLDEPPGNTIHRHKECFSCSTLKESCVSTAFLHKPSMERINLISMERINLISMENPT